MSIFDDIQVGQQVVIHNPYNRYELEVHTVEKITKTQVTIGGKRYRKSDGYQVGKEAYYGPSIQAKHYPHYGLMTPEEATKENARRDQELKHLRLVNKIRGVSFREKSYEVLVKVAELLGVEVDE